jgi:hypothetical protein
MIPSISIQGTIGFVWKRINMPSKLRSETNNAEDVQVGRNEFRIIGPSVPNGEHMVGVQVSFWKISQWGFGTIWKARSLIQNGTRRPSATYLLK